MRSRWHALGSSAGDPDACKSPVASPWLMPYIWQLQLLIHEGRHSEPGDPYHTDCEEGGALSKDQELEGGSGYAWAALYLMWVYEYSLYDPPEIKDWARQSVIQLLNGRFCTPPSHSDPRVQAILDELSSG